jgi:hypothetical protein
MIADVLFYFPTEPGAARNIKVLSLYAPALMHRKDHDFCLVSFGITAK